LYGLQALGSYPCQAGRAKGSETDSCWVSAAAAHWRISTIRLLVIASLTAIRNAANDGNPATDSDSTWFSFITTPPFPDYISGHSTFSGAASTVLALFYGTDHIAFTTGSDFLPGVVRPFESFSAAAQEAAVSRLYGGIHFPFANEDGLQSGLGIGEFTFSHYLRPKGQRSRK